MIGKPSSPVRREAARKRTSHRLAPRRAADPTRTLADGWAFAKLYTSEKARRAALPAFLHDYNHHRPHTAIGKLAPITRVLNVSGQDLIEVHE